MEFQLLYVCDACYTDYMPMLNFVPREKGYEFEKCAFCGRKKYSSLYIVTPRHEDKPDN